MSEHIKFLPKNGRYWDCCSICGEPPGSNDCWDLQGFVDPDFVCKKCKKAVEAAVQQRKYLNERQ